MDRFPSHRDSMSTAPNETTQAYSWLCQEDVIRSITIKSSLNYELDARSNPKPKLDWSFLSVKGADGSLSESDAYEIEQFLSNIEWVAHVEGRCFVKDAEIYLVGTSRNSKSRLTAQIRIP